LAGPGQTSQPPVNINPIPAKPKTPAPLENNCILPFVYKLWKAQETKAIFEAAHSKLQMHAFTLLSNPKVETQNNFVL